MYADLQTDGEKLWERFNAEKNKIAWYYDGVISSLKELESFVPYIKLKEYFKKVFD